MNQRNAFAALTRGNNVFLTGAAGSGKTFVLNKFIAWLKKEKIGVAVTASTGIAATHLGGTTVHSWSGIGIKDQLTEKDLNKMGRNFKLVNRLERTSVLIIDEISMLHARQLDMIDRVCRHFKEPHLSFGGLQVVLCGDFFQLPPVSGAGQEKARFAFEAEVWNRMDLKICYLDEQHRQKDGEILQILNGIRDNKVTEVIVASLNSRIGMPTAGGSESPRLYTHNRDVDRENNLELGKIKEPAMRYSMQERGKKKLITALKYGCLAPEILDLKKGAQVMFVKNNFEVGYVNGTVGKVVGFTEEARMPIVETRSGRRIEAAPEDWSVEEDNRAVASIRQIPLRLAWAITVHKSQGMSLDCAEIDLARSFEFGMGYVALSRVRTLAGMRLIGLNDTALLVNPRIIEFDSELVRLSAEFEQEIKDSGVADIRPKRDETAITRSYDVEDVRKQFGSAYQPWEADDDDSLRKYFGQGKSTRELAEKFNRTRGAVRSRLKKLGLITGK